jgi:transcriptional regulator with XRE-family HTH domain
LVNNKYTIFGYIVKNIGFCIRLKEIRESLSLNQKTFSEMLGIRQNYLSRYESGEHEVTDELKLQMIKVVYQNYKRRINLDWLLTGEGSMFLLQDNPQVEIHNSGAVNGVINAIGNVGNNEMIISNNEPPSDYDKADPKRGISVFKIPLLTKEQVLHFDPDREISSPKAYSGNYPDYTLVPIPFRFREYSTDLRALVVFNGLMTPLLNPGDVAIFQATGWNGDGVYVYRMGGDLHISHVKFCGRAYRLFKEFRPDEEISFDVGTFEVIGRVRAVVREIG